MNEIILSVYVVYSSLLSILMKLCCVKTAIDL